MRVFKKGICLLLVLLTAVVVASPLGGCKQKAKGQYSVGGEKAG